MANYNIDSGFIDTQDNLSSFVDKYSVADTGPYIGVVKNTVDPLKMGRLGVLIPEIAHVPQHSKDSGKVIWCQYLSPFYGVKPFRSVSKTDPYSHKTSQTSYGMWAVPPDIDTNVLVLFAKGEKGQAGAFWIGCVQEPLTNHMVPGNGASINTAVGVDQVGDMSTEGKDDIYGTNFVPAVEKNKRMYGDGETLASLNKWKLPVNEDLANQLKIQGLIKDPVRGTTSSSARRESPSQVFGLSTPGRIKEDSRQPNIGLEGMPVRVDRKPGHSFVMDDGAVNGTNQLVRLRTATGHQILMNDSEGVIYIANASGNAWIEMNAEGKIDVYSRGGIHFRTEKDFNLHSDANINMHAGGAIRMSSNNEIINSAPILLSMGEDGVLTSSMKGAVQTYGAAGITSYTSGQQLHGAAGGTHLAGGQIHFNSVGYNTEWGPQWSKERANIAPREEFDVELNGKGGMIPLEEGTRKTETTVHRFVTHEPMFRYKAFSCEGVVPAPEEDVDITIGSTKAGPLLGTKVKVAGPMKYLQAGSGEKKKKFDDKMDTKMWSRLSSTPGTVEFNEQRNRLSENEVIRSGQFQCDAETYLKKTMGNSTDTIKASKLLDNYVKTYDKTFNVINQVKGVWDKATSISNKISNIETKIKGLDVNNPNEMKNNLTMQLTSQLIEKAKGLKAVELFKNKVLVGNGGQIFTIGNIDLGKINMGQVSGAMDTVNQLSSLKNDIKNKNFSSAINTISSVSNVYNSVTGGKITNTIFSNILKGKGSISMKAGPMKYLQAGSGFLKSGAAGGTKLGFVSTTLNSIGTYGKAIGAFFQGFKWSDVRLKEDIQLIGKSPSGTNIYSFKYKHVDGTYQGVMAHEVPWAREMTDTGFYIVDYSKLDVGFRRIH